MILRINYLYRAWVCHVHHWILWLLWCHQRKQMLTGNCKCFSDPTSMGVDGTAGFQANNFIYVKNYFFHILRPFFGTTLSKLFLMCNLACFMKIFAISFATTNRARLLGAPLTRKSSNFWLLCARHFADTHQLIYVVM